MFQISQGGGDEMKRYSVFLTLFFVLLWPSSSQAVVEVEVSTPITCLRSTGAPVTETFTFPGLAGAATVKLWNGSLEDDSIEKVSSSTVTLNSQEVFGPSNFNQNVDYLEGQATLGEGQNTLQVCLKGKPGGQLTIQILQEVEADGAAVVGPEGGVSEVTDPDSPIYGTKVRIPEGALMEPEIIAISVSSEDYDLPEGNVSNGPGVKFTCSNSCSFSEAVVVELPVDDHPGSGECLEVLYYNENTDNWETVNSWYACEAEKMIFLSDHFSLYKPVKKQMPFMGIELFTEFDLNTDTMSYENNNFSHCPAASAGVCSGVAFFAEWYFNNKGHGLKCRYNPDTGQQISCEIYLDYLWLTWDFEPPEDYCIGNIDYSSTVSALIRALSSGDVKCLWLDEVEYVGFACKFKSGHAVVVYGWTPQVDSGDGVFGFFTCYDVNDNENEIKVYVKNEQDQNGNRYVSMSVENQPKWMVFIIPDTSSIESKMANVCDSYPADNCQPNDVSPWCLECSWSTPVELLVNPGGYPTGVSIAADQNSDWHIVYDIGVNTSSGGYTHLKYMNETSGPLTIAESSYVVDENGVFGTNLVAYSIAADQKGGLHAAYRLSEIGLTGNTRIMYLNNLTGSWSTPVELLVNPGGYPTGVSIAADQNSDWHIVYDIGVNTSSGGYTHLKYMNETSGPLTIAESSYVVDENGVFGTNLVAYSIAADQKGGLHAAYRLSEIGLTGNTRIMYVNNPVSGP